jgi:alpha-tubulin suppressor-like RCC1 family protein
MKKLLALVSIISCSMLHLPAVDPQIAAGDNHTLILCPDGTVVSYGRNNFGQLGDGTTVNRSTPVQVTNLSGVTAIAAGGTHSMAVSNGIVYAWGNGGSGRLGNGTTANKHVPTRVTNLTDVVSVAAGGNFSLALKSNGTIWSFGANASGQLGDGSLDPSSVPIEVYANFSTLIAAGSLHGASCTASEIWPGTNNMMGWGDSPGSGFDPADWPPYYEFPVDSFIAEEPVVYPLIQLASGDSSSYALDSAGQVWSFGGNSYGQLGEGSTTPAYPWGFNPETGRACVLVGISNVVAIASGGTHVLALLDNGEVWAWGGGTYGKIGDGAKVNRWSPVQVPNTGSGGSNIVAIAAGANHSVALATDGTNFTAVGWGHYNYGQLGIGRFDFRSTAGNVWDLSATTNSLGATNLSSATAAGSGNSLVLLTNGTVASWGENGLGQCGDATSTDRPTPVLVSHSAGVYLQGITNLAVGNDHSLAISNGIIWAWGYGANGRLGNGSSSTQTSPVQVANLTDVINVAARGSSLAVRGTDGSVWAWGYLGFGTNTYSQNVPQQVTNNTGSPLLGFSRVAVGNDHNLALTTNGLVWAWGDGAYGKLGVGSTNDYTNAVQIPSLSNVTGISSGYDHSLALSNGTIYAWGHNGYGQLGLNDFTKRTSPVAAGSGYTSVVAGHFHTLALKTNGTVWVCGANGRGQLGLGNTTDYKVLTQVPGVSNVVSIAGGYQHSIAVQANGNVLVWGDTTEGQLGNGDIGYTTALVPVP